MSAWQVRGTHIAAMVDAAIVLKRIPLDDREKVCKMLAEENAKSVNYRYEGRDGFPAPAVRDFPPFNHLAIKLKTGYYHSQFGPSIPAGDGKGYSLITLLKAVDCYEYQACEHEGWKESESRKFCSRLRKALIAAFPEYNDCEGWGL